MLFTPSYRERIYEDLYEHIEAVYGSEQALPLFERLLDLIGNQPEPKPRDLPLSERDAILITYGDQVRRAGEAPLVTMHDVLKRTIAPTINSLHILPFFPYSSDDGFSVMDYYAVDPQLGDWSHIRDLQTDFLLMFDAVFNHISARSEWFRRFCDGEAPYDNYFICVPPETDLSAVVRPRALPLLTPVDTVNGEKFVWTTFSPDQIDLNYGNPDVLLEMVKVLLYYVEQGASLVRLDAVAFIWKRIGSSSIHMPETHEIIQLMHDVLQLVAPDTIIITETNVPHEENISYFGSGDNEAQMVYQFSLPPLVLHTLYTGDATVLSNWASTIKRISDKTTFFNFAASHDGIGMRPATGILSDDEINALVEMTHAHGGAVGYKSNSDGSKSPYELNITYFDAITDPKITADNPDLAVQRFMVSQAIMLAFMGVPGIYFHSLFGSQNYSEGVKVTGHNRTINREKINADTLLHELDDPTSLRARVYTAYMHLLNVRTNEPAFHPLGGQLVMNRGKEVFAIERTSPDGQHRVFALHNVTGQPLTLTLPWDGEWCDLITAQSMSGQQITLAPYQVAWLKPM